MYMCVYLERRRRSLPTCPAPASLVTPSVVGAPPANSMEGDCCGGKGKHVRCGDSSHTKGTPVHLLKDLPLGTTVQST